MSKASKTYRSLEESELLGAALRYCAVADWFEGPPGPRKHLSREEAMALFDRAERDLREVAAQLLRRRGHRQLVLASANVPEATSPPAPAPLPKRAR